MPVFKKVKEIRNMNKMSFDEFKDAVVGRVLEFLPESFEGSEVSLNVVTKPNDVKLTGLTIRKANSCMAPTIYLEDFYSQIESGDNIGIVMRRIADVRMEHEIDDIDLDEVMDFDGCKDKIIPRLYGAEMNNELITHRVHTKIGDFIVVYSIDMGTTERGRLNLPIDEALLNKWDIKVEDLHKIALENQNRHHEGTFRSMSDVLKSMFKDEDIEDELIEDIFTPAEDTAMYVISNKSCMNGASMILDKEFMDSVADVIGDDFIILPSSIHEVLAIPNSNLMELEYMETMVYEINRTQVSVGDRLSDHVYRYTKENGLVRAAA